MISYFFILGSVDAVVISDKGEPEDTYRCTSCPQSFQNIDKLIDHQNDQGHIELKQTPRGPCYLCWKKGCNQYFRTASAVQIHFREIHASKKHVSVSDRHVYKYRCNQCSLAFKTMDKLQLHSQYHMIRAASKCNMCGRSFRSVPAMRKHVETTHIDTMSETEVEQYKAQIAALPPMISGDSASTEDDNISECPPKLVRPDGRDGVEDEDESMDTEEEPATDKMLEEYMNSQAMAENSYNDPGRKHKCHRCKVAFTRQIYLTAHNKTVMHRKGDKVSFALEKFLDPNRPYKCETCKESFTQKNILLVHFNSVSHLHKLKQSEGNDGVNSPSESPVAATTLPTTASPNNTPSPNNNNNDPDKKPYRCNICKVAYSQGSNLDIHVRSVYHQTRTSKLQELALTGHVDLSQPLIEQPEATTTTTQHKKVLAEMLQQKQPSLGPVKGLQLPLLPPTSTAAAVTSSSIVKPSATLGKQSNLELTCHRCSTSCNSAQELVIHQQMHCYSLPSATPSLRSNRLVARYQPQLQHSLLQNIGFECVMQYNENRQRVIKKEKEEKDDKEKDPDVVINGNEIEEDNKDTEKPPEMSKSTCSQCHKDFSSIWVLKAHQEEIHDNMVPCKLVQQYSEKFKDDYAKNHPVESEPTPASSAPSTPASVSVKTESPNDITPSKAVTSIEDSNPPTPTTPIDMMAAQMMQMPMFGMMPMPLAMNMAPPLMPMMMHLGGEFGFPGVPGMPGMPMIDPSVLAAQQQQQQQAVAAAAAQAQQQKRARTRISDDQLKILRTYFDINNSPSEAQINEMADKSGLPAKVIKHWFRNTLFKERQRNKDSPYNFSIPPSTPLNLEEYEKTGKITTTETDKSLCEKSKDEKISKSEVDIREATQTPDRESAASQDGSILSSTPSTSAPSTPAPPMPPNPSFMLTAMAPTFSAAATHQEIVSALKSSPFAPPSIISAGDQASMHENIMAHMHQSHNSSGGPKRANRTRFSDYQIQVPQDFFDQNAYPKDEDLDHMSKLLNLNPRVIVVWFQNARQKARKNYENQPSVEVVNDDSSPTSQFQRTPGLNYQCKQCLTVFQRYYELIKHQKQCGCDNDSNHLSPTNVNNSNSESSNTPESKSHSSPEKVIDIRPISPKAESEIGENLKYKCEKCNLSFTHADLWQEHQNIHLMNPTLFAGYAPDSAFAMLQSVAQQHTPASSKEEDERIAGQKRKAEDDLEEDDSNSSSEQQRDKRLRTTILPEQLDYLYQKYSLDCNPSRKQLDSISEEVGLKKRVVQV